MREHFKFGDYMKLRCQELVRLVHFRVLNSVAISAIAGSSARDLICEEAKALEFDYEYFDGSSIAGSFKNVGIHEKIEAVAKDDKLVILYNFADIVNESFLVETVIRRLITDGTSVILCGGDSNQYSKKYYNLLDHFDFSLRMHKR